jgi:hypothetical protein
MDTTPYDIRVAAPSRLASRDQGQAREQVLVRGLLEVRGVNDFVTFRTLFYV